MSEGFGVRTIFGSIFTGHREEELEAHWATGTIGNIPSIEAVDTSCPRPWGFVRIVCFSVIAYLLLLYGWYRFHNVNLLPGLMVVGAAALPIGVTYLFFELNIRRNVSMYLVEKLLFIGGILSLIFSLFMFLLTARLSLSFLGDSVAGIAEETGKLLAVVLVARRSRYPYVLNGILFGVAVGSGFAFLETAGYVMNELVKGIIAGTLLNNEEIMTMIANTNINNIDPIIGKVYEVIAAEADKGMLALLTVRSLMAPLGHMVWTGIAAGGLWMACETDWSAGRLAKIQFWGLFLVAVVLHGLWNAPFGFCIVCSYDKYILLGLIGWAVLFFEIRLGIEQVRKEKEAALASFVTATLENGIGEVLQLQKAYADYIALPAVAVKPSVKPAPAPRAEDHLCMDSAVEKSKEREEHRTRPDVANRRWEKYYQNSEDSEKSVYSSIGTRERNESENSGGTSSGRSSWRKYYRE